MPSTSRNEHGAVRLRRYLLKRSRPQKAAITVTVDLFGFFVCGMVATWLSGVILDPAALTTLLVATIASSVLTGKLAGLYRSVIRFLNGVDLVKSALIVSILPCLIGTAYVFNTSAPEIAVRWAFAYLAASVSYVTASRYFALWFLAAVSSRKSVNVIVYGAGSAGAQLVDSLRSHRKFRPVALVDDDSSLHGKRVKGVDVYPPDTIRTLMEKRKADRVLLAMPSVSRKRRKRILSWLADEHIRVQTIPGMQDILSGRASVTDVLDIEVTDILGREPVTPDTDLLQSSILGKTVLVTGAGGSIGSELCRQILMLKPTCIVLLEISEPALYMINKELASLRRRESLDVDVVALLGSVHHEERLREIIRNFKVQTIYHAAAYKHVPIVEHNLFEGIHNNIFGTLHTARAAAAAGVEKFVLISTDKAVHPTNVMGATKRSAELVLQAMQTKYTDTTFCMVRFGNVLESSGSVVPLFREQIKAGGPVTVTHRDIIRYFMTIPEAAQLVIQASSLARGGDVFVLDMGEPVKILDLAQRMISLMGLTVVTDDNPDGDIRIEYIGLRPAEKLYEELLIGTNVHGTAHPRILKAEEEMMNFDTLDGLLSELRRSSEALDYEEARALLRSIVREYEPANGIEDLVCNRAAEATSTTPETIIEFPKRPA